MNWNIATLTTAELMTEPPSVNDIQLVPESPQVYLLMQNILVPEYNENLFSINPGSVACLRFNDQEAWTYLWKSTTNALPCLWSLQPFADPGEPNSGCDLVISHENGSYVITGINRMEISDPNLRLQSIHNNSDHHISVALIDALGNSTKIVLAKNEKQMLNEEVLIKFQACDPSVSQLTCLGIQVNAHRASYETLYIMGVMYDQYGTPYCLRRMHLHGDLGMHLRMHLNLNASGGIVLVGTMDLDPRIQKITHLSH